ncbi:MAG TPA: SRPBCC family protein [Acidimicrobiales bacterium]|nr:SRPBCC family protein [Acidimicrobiales bacterium]
MPSLTKQRTLLGMPVGRRRPDWPKVARYAAMGLGAVSTAAGGLRAGRQVKDTAKATTDAARSTLDKVGDAAGKASDIGSAITPGGGDGGGDREENLKKLRLIIKESIDVGVPLKTAYNQWTQFADMPTYMKGPQSIDHEADDEARWVVKIGPSRRRWTAKILEQDPDERIVWESTDGTENRGVVTFHRLDGNLTRVQVEMEYFPNGFVEKVGNIFLVARRRVRKDLRLYKHFLELAGSETGAWRGEITGEGEDGAEGGAGGGNGSAEHETETTTARTG